MNTTALRSLQQLAEALPQETLSLTYKDKSGQHTVPVNYSPLTGTVTVGKIACSKSELPAYLELFYKAELIELK